MPSVVRARRPWGGAVRLKTPGDPPTIPGPAASLPIPPGGGASPAPSTHCVCGRLRLHGSGHLAHDPATTAIMQRLETIRELRLTIATSPPIDLPALKALYREAQDLRVHLARLAHAK